MELPTLKKLKKAGWVYSEVAEAGGEKETVYFLRGDDKLEIMPNRNSVTFNGRYIRTDAQLSSTVLIRR